MGLLQQSFYLQDAIAVAQQLLGKILVRRVGEKRYYFKIVETEAYMGEIDKAAHSYKGKRTARTEVIFHKGGTIYIYFIYGMYYCLNIVANEEEVPQAVLIRAVEPMDEESLLYARENRPIKSKKVADLTNGPGKLCAAMAIDKSINGMTVTEKEVLWIEDAQEPFEMVADKRINIPYAEEFQEVEWRFYIKDNPFVSVLKK